MECNHNISNNTQSPVEEQYEYDKFGRFKTLAYRYRCPNCNNILNAGPNYQPKFCDACGLRLSFTNIKFKEEISIHNS